jgi:hypothetical protein
MLPQILKSRENFIKMVFHFARKLFSFSRYCATFRWFTRTAIKSSPKTPTELFLVK